ncbi:MAG: hypothetical protein Tp185DCM00d2C31949971_26 [Prokaryotic dsDNA virus sp.]|mgnify:CR=1 FL=1|uniref:hypothetical protein n=1 Tax=Gammaproteobacteria TaxID=1236 RepID=UPI000ED1E17F|nr:MULTISPECIES: hypothetical protein [Gammaproteobacteria]QDP60910.1 MAG: hypothetical protein Tp185DCM00d2C31949971_26 [Prokaryotic dsDNA virus sp.]QDP61820.1 MAG: hypothetical protein Tp1111MES1053591_59 [Prokaryotic dsDNA virus sp.]HCC80368.1 hypothetical protein [Methylophaga sp.]|tara:strand:+ start:25587 stop:26099 length:513 start_codon:yes stop_codon:yes gene_type:complete
MPYMKNDTISQSPIEGGIEISGAQYQSLLAAKLEGKTVTVKNDEPFIYSGEKRTVYRLVNNVVESQEIYSEDDTPSGWQATEPTPDPEPITQVSRAQGKVALISAGHWASVVAFVDAIPDPTQKALAEVALYDTTTWQRNSPFLATAASQIGLTETDLDNLFLAASQIQL